MLICYETMLTLRLAHRDDITFDVQPVREPRTRCRGCNADVDGFGDLGPCSVTHSETIGEDVTFQASMRTPTPEPIKIIQLVCSLLSMRYSKIMICTTTFVAIFVAKALGTVEHE